MIEQQKRRQVDEENYKAMGIIAIGVMGIIGAITAGAIVLADEKNEPHLSLNLSINPSTVDVKTGRLLVPHRGTLTAECTASGLIPNKVTLIFNGYPLAESVSGSTSVTGKVDTAYLNIAPQEFSCTAEAEVDTKPVGIIGKQQTPQTIRASVSESILFSK